MIAAAFALFEKGESTIELPSGKVVTFHAAKMKHMAPVMKFITGVVGSLETSELGKLIELIGAKQRKLMEEGKNPRKMDLQDIVTDDMVTSAFNNASIVSTLAASAFDLLPDFVKLFTDLTPEDFNELRFDEGTLVAAGVFVMNYDFFFHRLRPILMAVIRSLASEHQKRGAAGVKKALTKMSNTK